MQRQIRHGIGAAGAGIREQEVLSVEFSAGSVLATATLNASVSSAELAACRTSLEAGNFTTTVRGTPWAARAYETGEGPGSQYIGWTQLCRPWAGGGGGFN